MTDALPTIITGTMVEDAAEALLTEWLPFYLAQIADQNDVDKANLPGIRSFVRVNDFDKWPDSQLPAALITCPGTEGTPKKDGRRRFRIRFGLIIGIIVSANTEANTSILAKLYAAAIRTTFLRHPSMQGFSLSVDWEDEGYDENLPTDDSRSLAAARLAFEVEVQQEALGVAPTSAPVDPLAAVTPNLDFEDVQVTATPEAEL